MDKGSEGLKAALFVPNAVKKKWLILVTFDKIKSFQEIFTFSTAGDSTMGSNLSGNIRLVFHLSLISCHYPFVFPMHTV